MAAGSDQETLGPLLNVLAQSLDVREVFARISALARHTVPHDCLLFGLVAEASAGKAEGRAGQHGAPVAGWEGTPRTGAKAEAGGDQARAERLAARVGVAHKARLLGAAAPQGPALTQYLGGRAEESELPT